MGIKEASQSLCYMPQKQRERDLDSGEVNGGRSVELLPPVSKISFKSLTFNRKILCTFCSIVHHIAKFLIL